jgi:hypothetical protein
VKRRDTNNLKGVLGMKLVSVGPVRTLADGVAVADPFQENKRTVSTRILTDPEVHALELERIFDRCWILVGHESEIPSPGDFVSRYIGADPVIVARGTDGAIHISLKKARRCPWGHRARRRQ